MAKRTRSSRASDRTRSAGPHAFVLPALSAFAPEGRRESKGPRDSFHDAVSECGGPERSAGPHFTHCWRRPFWRERSRLKYSRCPWISRYSASESRLPNCWTSLLGQVTSSANCFRGADTRGQLGSIGAHDAVGVASKALPAVPARSGMELHLHNGIESANGCVMPHTLRPQENTAPMTLLPSGFLTDWSASV